ncbi:MAG: hypothetical protein Q7S89_02030 [bacterium]|nr:hypothetical protein [bacterium]
MKDVLVRPKVKPNVLPTWMKIVSSNSGQDLICAACARIIRNGIGSLQVRDDAPGSVRSVMVMIALSSIALEPPSESPNTYGSVKQVARAILQGDSVTFGSTANGATQCIVAANAPDACDRWEDWQTMRTLRSSESSRAFFPFCDTCRSIVEKERKIGAVFGVTLFEAITNKKPDDPKSRPTEKADSRPMAKVIAFPTEPEADIVPIGNVRAHERRPVVEERVASKVRVGCSFNPQVTGDPNERMGEVPTFTLHAFAAYDSCLDGLSQTGSRYEDLVRMHEPRESRRNSTEWDNAKQDAKTCNLHGPETRALGGFRANVIQQIQANWPDQWKARGKTEGTGGLRCSQGGEYVRLLFNPNTYLPIAAGSDFNAGGVCGGCKDRLKNARTRATRGKLARSTRDSQIRLGMRGSSGGGGNKQKQQQGGRKSKKK